MAGLHLGLVVGVEQAGPAPAGRVGKEHVFLGHRQGINGFNELLVLHRWVGVLAA